MGQRQATQPYNGGPGGPMVSVSASHREGPEICPKPVYKRHCAEKFRLKKITGSPEYTGTDMLVKSVETKVRTGRAYDVAEVNRSVPAQMTTSSLDRGSKLRGVIGRVKALHGG